MYNKKKWISVIETSIFVNGSYIARTEHYFYLSYRFYHLPSKLKYFQSLKTFATIRFLMNLLIFNLHCIKNWVKIIIKQETILRLSRALIPHYLNHFSIPWSFDPFIQWGNCKPSPSFGINSKNQKPSFISSSCPSWILKWLLDSSISRLQLISWSPGIIGKTFVVWSDQSKLIPV